LPSEAQWEYAAKAGRDEPSLHREPRDARGKPVANFWQGDFPTHNSLQDGYATSAPVGCFAPNSFGLFDMLGNAWEWTGSPYTSSHHPDDRRDAMLAQHTTRLESESEDVACSAPARRGAHLVLKGGSFLCAPSFCARYRVAARHAQEADQPAMHVGFRTVQSAR
jgi:formylglycine-generating enzyme required for sulfatase activity